MKTQHITLLILCSVLCGCGRNGDSASSSNASWTKNYDEQLKRQQALLDTNEAQQKLAADEFRARADMQKRADDLLQSQEEMHKRAGAVLATQEQLLKRQQDDMARFEKILDAWETQQKQYQKYLDSLPK